MSGINGIIEGNGQTTVALADGIANDYAVGIAEFPFAITQTDIEQPHTHNRITGRGKPTMETITTSDFIEIKGEHELRDELREALRTHNRLRNPHLYYNEDGPIIKAHTTYVLCDDTGAVSAGLTADVVWGAMYIDILWVADALRGQGIGTQLMQRAEAAARQMGLNFVWLGTFSFQALGFYEKMGYEIIGQVGNYPPGYAYYTLRKDL